MSERLERLVNLTATLLDTRRPLSLDELATRLEPSYPAEKVARRRAFERDKETLRELGVPIVTEPVEGAGGDVGYRIPPDEYYLPDPGLTDEERAALLRGDVAWLYARGAHPFLLAYLTRWELFGLTVPLYSERIRTAHEPVHTE